MGWIAGMLINYLADVLPTCRRLCKPICLACNNTFPVLSYLLPTSNCPSCRQPRSARYWGVNIISTVMALVIYSSSHTRFPYLVSLLLLVYLGVVTVIDLEHRLILHPVTLTGALLAFPFGVLSHGWIATILGGLAGFGSMFAVYFLGRLLITVIGRWQGANTDGEALGFGDVTLSGVLGLLLGWPGIVAGILIAILLSGAVSLIYMLAKMTRREYRHDLALPYGPFLTISAFLLLFFPRIFLSNL